MPLKLVIFDMDGTLLVTPLDFDAIRAEIGLPEGMPILEAMGGLTDAERARANRVIDRHEAEAGEESQLMPGAERLLTWLRSRGTAEPASSVPSAATTLSSMRLWPAKTTSPSRVQPACTA